jgi:hypothetical protein
VVDCYDLLHVSVEAPRRELASGSAGSRHEAKVVLEQRPLDGDGQSTVPPKGSSALTSRAYITAAFALSACHAWPSRPVSELGSARRTVRVVTSSGRRRTVLENAALVGDSVVGRLAATDTLGSEGWTPLRAGTGEQAAIAVSAVTRVEVRTLDKRRMFGPIAILGIAAVVWVTVVVVRAMVALYTY